MSRTGTGSSSNAMRMTTILCQAGRRRQCLRTGVMLPTILHRSPPPEITGAITSRRSVSLMLAVADNAFFIDVLLFMALPAFVWVEIESSTVRVDGGLEVLRVAEAAGRLLDPLDHRVDRLETRIGEAVLQVGQQIGQVALDQLGDHDHRPQAAVGGAPEPAPEEAARRAKVGVLPEGPEPFLEGPGAGHLEIALL